MKSDTPLTGEDLKKFKISCGEIINDAKLASKGVEVKSEVTFVPSAPVLSRKVPSVAVVEDEEKVAARRTGEDVVHKGPAPKKLTAEEYNVIWEAGEGPSSEDKPDPNSPFANLHGVKNTWQIPGMDNMSTEEYYAAINKRLLDMKSKRKITEGSSNTMVNDYFDSLSKPRKST
jgi:hypothetical protein